MLRIGCVALSVWVGFQWLLAFGIVVAVVGFHQNAPALTILFHGDTAAHIEARALATINSLCILLNSCVVAFCTLLLVTTWAAVRKGARWAFAGVATSLCTLQVAGFLSDIPLGHVDLIPNLVSSALLAIGLVTTGAGLGRP